MSLGVTESGSVLANPVPPGITFHFEPDSATRTLSLLDTDDDADDEPDATVTLTLQAGEDHALGDPSEAAVTVRDDDGPPEVSITDAAPVTEGDTLRFPVRLSHSSDTRIVVQASHRLGGGAGGAVTFTVTFAPGDTEQTISLATVNDDADWIRSGPIETGGGRGSIPASVRNSAGERWPSDWYGRM